MQAGVFLKGDEMKIQAAVLVEPKQPFAIETVDLEGPRAGEVLVKLSAAGVCHSDWHLATGATRHPLPVVPGHEGAGVIADTGPGVAHLKPGMHVALSWAPSCGRCFYCLHDRPSLCGAYTAPVWAGTLLDGTPRLSWRGAPLYHFCALACFAEYAVVPQECCVPMPHEVPLEIAALIGCAVTTGVGAVLHSARVPAGASVAVFGAGGVGLSALVGAQLVGATPIIAVDRMEEKLALAKNFGASDTVVAGPHAAEEIQKLTQGRGADFVIEAIGSPAVQEQCLHAARPGGTVVLAGLAPMGSGTNFPGALITRQEKIVMGCYYGSAHPPRDFPALAGFYRSGQLPLEKLVSSRWKLDQINEAYKEMLEGSGARGVVIFE